MNKATTVMVELGNYNLGHKTTDREGNVIREVPLRWTTVPDGCNIVVVPVDSETGEQSGSASLCAHWDTERVASQLFELLGLPRNMPSLAPIWLAAKEDGLDLCGYCQQQGELCDKCAIAEAVRDLEAEADDRG